MPKYPKKELAQLVLQQCVANNVENVVISPGSRNAPLTIGFVNHPKINTLSVVDERSAGFFALGIAQQSQKPVAVLCSSGSALLNYYPAIAEAYYSKIPLVVISTDRPKHLIDIGDGQTIRQENVFHNHILFSANLNEYTSDRLVDISSPTQRDKASIAEIDLVSNNKLLQKALQITVEQNGPVHINVPFDEPLYETTDELYDFIFKIKKEENRILKDSLLDEVPLEVDELQKFANVWNDTSKKIVLIGANYPDEMLQTQLDHMIGDPSVLVFTETTSNQYHHNFVNSIDQLISPLNDEEFNSLQPDILLTIGGMVVSKRVKKFLRKFQPKHHWHVDKKNSPDTYHCLNHHFAVSPQLFFSQFFFITAKMESNYQKKWLTVKKTRQLHHNKYLSDLVFSDLKVFDIIIKSLPGNINLQLSNSSVIRYTQLFDLDKSTRVFCNRGTSGIDGSTSTAIGASYSCQDKTIFITGDISFLYDSNALWNKYIKKDFRIILVNNSGGGIFRFIPGPKTTNALDYFETTHQLNASHLCRMFDFEYMTAKNENELKSHLISFYKDSNQPKLLEIFTPSNLNDEILKGYFNSLD